MNRQKRARQVADIHADHNTSAVAKGPVQGPQPKPLPKLLAPNDDFEIVETSHPFVSETVDWRAWRKAAKAALGVNDRSALEELGYQGCHQNLLAYLKHATMKQVPPHLRQIIHRNMNWASLHKDFIAMDSETKAQRRLLWLGHNGKLAVFEFSRRLRRPPT